MRIKSFFITFNWENGMGGIKNTAVRFGELFCKTYKISIAAKGSIRTDFSIDFLKRDLFHATGLQYLKDIDLDKDPNDVYDKILAGVVNDELLEKSSFYLKVEDNYVNVKERIEQVAYLEECLDSKNLIFKYIGGKNPYSKIKAEYLIEASLYGKIFLIFLTKRKESENYRIVSFFEKRSQYKTEKCFWLYKAKCNHETGETIVFYDKLSKVEE